ncbi:divergent polysaccharide deacetylase family protein [Alteromonas oceanisediminis]|uniref:divergent polysaccharide deacetylase family protein n=1 Tax=Alteromonas oceanisediminis TaxID=2836180 RepID=UPI002023BB55|nr:divergent polysaccharide deacetylase family protein [Alteromonas oceanisediminis]
MLICFGVQAQPPKVAIIMDDMGYRTTDIAAFDLPTSVTFAILPHTPKSVEFAHSATEQGRIVMLHLPMETLNPHNLGPGALLTQMDASMIARTLDDALKSVPYAVGVNNHMGSKLTQLSLPMTNLMTALAERQLFFVDSRTTPLSKAHRIALAAGVPSLQRKVFLDHELTDEFIQAQFQRLVRLAHKYGQSIGIAHPHPLTVERLKSLIANTDGIEFVPITALFSSGQKALLANRNPLTPISTTSAP